MINVFLYLRNVLVDLQSMYIDGSKKNPKQYSYQMVMNLMEVQVKHSPTKHIKSLTSEFRWDL